MPAEKQVENAEPSYLGHRQRLRERFSKSGFEGFHDYEKLELLLSFAIPRRDTKPIAKDLLKKFKSLSAVLDAGADDLQAVEGIGEHAATFLQVVREVMATYFHTLSMERKQFSSLDDLVTYLRATIGGKPNEVLHALYLNSKNELIAAEDLGEGTVTEASAFPRRVVEEALQRRATSVILAHNHPGGLAEPSGGDLEITKAIQTALRTVDISLQEHIIISDDGTFSFRREGLVE